MMCSICRHWCGAIFVVLFSIQIFILGFQLIIFFFFFPATDKFILKVSGVLAQKLIINVGRTQESINKATSKIRIWIFSLSCQPVCVNLASVILWFDVSQWTLSAQSPVSRQLFCKVRMIVLQMKQNGLFNISSLVGVVIMQRTQLLESQKLDMNPNSATH